MNRKGIEMNRIIKFFVGLLILAAFFKVGYAGERGPGKYCGVVVFDRWDGCILYSGIYVMYISEDVKENLRKYAGKPVQINATKVFQPINPGDGLIKEFECLGPAPEKRKWVSLAGLKLKSFPAFEDGEKPSVTMELLNAGEEDLEVFSSELAPTLLTTQSSKTRTFSPSDGPSIALITRQSFCVGGSEYRWEGGGVTQGGRCSWTIRKENALPRKFVLKAGQEKQIVITFDLPEGEYEFLCGYGGGTHGSKCLASNLVAFDVGKDGKGKVIKDNVFNELEEKISRQLKREKWSNASKAFIRALWNDYKAAHVEGQNREVRSIYGKLPDVYEYHEYVGKYVRKVGPGDKVFLEVAKTSEGRFIVKVENHDIPAVAVNRSIAFTTGDVVYSCLPQLGKKPYAALEMFMVVRLDGKYIFLSPGERPSEKNEFIKLNGE